MRMSKYIFVFAQAILRFSSFSIRLKSNVILTIFSGITSMGSRYERGRAYKPDRERKGQPGDSTAW